VHLIHGVLLLMCRAGIPRRPSTDRAAHP